MSMDSPAHEVPGTPSLRTTYGGYMTPCTDAVVPEMASDQSPALPCQDCVPGTPANRAPVYPGGVPGTPANRAPVYSGCVPGTPTNRTAACRTPRTGGRNHWPEENLYQPSPFRTPTRTRSRTCVPSPADHLVPGTPVSSNSGPMPKDRGPKLAPRNAQPYTPSPVSSCSFKRNNRTPLNSLGKRRDAKDFSRKPTIVHSRKVLTELRTSQEGNERREDVRKSPDLLDLI